MSWLSWGSGGEPEVAPQKNEDKEISLLLARLESSTLPEDKRATVEKIHEICDEHPTVIFDNEDMKVLINILQNEQDEDEMCQKIVQSFLALVDHGNATMTNIFVQQPSNITTLMDLLTKKYTYLRFYAVRLLSNLLVARVEKTQAVILTYPQGVNIITSLLMDRKEIIRNEVLLLLEALTHDNMAIQKIVAFDGGFEHLLQIAGSPHEEIVVIEDCLRIVGDMLQNNTSNQELFAELGLIRRLPDFLLYYSMSNRTDEEEAEQKQNLSLSSQQLSVLDLVLKIIWNVAAPTFETDADPSRINQTQTRLTCLLPGMYICIHIYYNTTA